MNREWQSVCTNVPNNGTTDNKNILKNISTPDIQGEHHHALTPRYSYHVNRNRIYIFIPFWIWEPDSRIGVCTPFIKGQQRWPHRGYPHEPAAPNSRGGISVGE